MKTAIQAVHSNPGSFLSKNRSTFFIICLLGSLSVISPFSIDMYLPAFSKVAEDYGVETTMVSLTLSSYFIGIAFGQILYGPLLDRYGRKKPLAAGLTLFILASLGCAAAPNIETLIVFRFIQAIGGCSAGVASLAMVRDIFPVKDGAKVLSLLFLFIAVSPLLAPSIGGFVMLAVSWKVVFLIMTAIVTLILAVTYVLLPESHQPDASISLRPMPIIREYLTIAKHPAFITYALSGAFSFAGLFTYVAGSPIIFMENFRLSANVYSAIFAVLAVGFIGGSQLNVWLLKRYESQALFMRVLTLQVIIGILFAAGTYLGWVGLTGTLVLFFLFLSCTGLTYPNAAALALSPFTKNAGSAAAMLGFIQLGCGAFISTFISTSDSRERFPIIAILAITSIIGYAILLCGRKKASMHSAITESDISF